MAVITKEFEIEIEDINDDDLVKEIRSRNLEYEFEDHFDCECSIRDFDDTELVEEILDRNLEERVYEQSDIPMPTNEMERQKVELFISHMQNLSWEQWNYIFKSIARSSDSDRGKFNKDYSLLLNETIK